MDRSVRRKLFVPGILSVKDFIHVLFKTARKIPTVPQYSTLCTRKWIYFLEKVIAYSTKIIYAPPDCAFERYFDGRRV